MKISQILAASLFLSGANAATRNLHENTTDLSNGAELAVGITVPAMDTKMKLGVGETTTGVIVKGEAHVGKGAPDVAYIYVIDSSDSTSDWDGACGTTLDCVQAFFEELHREVIKDGSAEIVAVVDFDDQAHITADFQDPSNPELQTAIRQGYSDGGTACSAALETATLLALQQKQSATTVVIFAGDGQCNGGDEGAAVVGENVTDSANLLGETGAIVHSIAVGDAVDCEPGNDLQNIPRNGGKCFSIPEPTALPSIIDDLIGTELTSVEVKVDDGDYRVLGFSETDGPTPPQEGAVSVKFEISVQGLGVGNHEVCIRAKGNDTLGGESEVFDCHRVIVEPAPTPAPTQAATTAAPTAGPTQTAPEKDPLLDGAPEGGSNMMEGWKILFIVVGCVGAIALAVHQMSRRAAGRETDRAAAEEAPENEFEDPYSPPVV